MVDKRTICRILQIIIRNKRLPKKLTRYVQTEHHVAISHGKDNVRTEKRVLRCNNNFRLFLTKHKTYQVHFNPGICAVLSLILYDYGEVTKYLTVQCKKVFRGYHNSAHLGNIWLEGTRFVQ